MIWRLEFSSWMDTAKFKCLQNGVHMGIECLSQSSQWTPPSDLFGHMNTSEGVRRDSVFEALAPSA